MAIQEDCWSRVVTPPRSIFHVISSLYTFQYSSVVTLTLCAKQSFQSNKTHRKLCEVLTTYQSLYYRKTLKKKV